MSRDWMDNTIDRFAYRCLPLNVSNSHGWEICCDESFEAVWNGGIKIEDVKVSSNIAISHFGSGVLTFHVPCVFRTDPGWNLMVMGPPNHPKRGIHALTGMIETDWAPYSFTMNWIFTEPNQTVRFLKDEPFCFFFPVQRGVVEKTEPMFADMREDAELYKQHLDWAESRRNFIKDLSVPNSTAAQEKWQRKYFHGQTIDGQVGSTEHQTKVRAKPFQTTR